VLLIVLTGLEVPVDINKKCFVIVIYAAILIGYITGCSFIRLSVCLSVCPSVPYWLLTWYEKRRETKIGVNVFHGIMGWKSAWGKKLQIADRILTDVCKLPTGCAKFCIFWPKFSNKHKIFLTIFRQPRILVAPSHDTTGRVSFQPKAHGLGLRSVRYS